MNRYAWWLSKGLIIVLPFVLVFLFCRGVIEYADAIWNNFLFEPVLSRDMPIAGFLLTIILLILIGAASETRIGRKVHENLIGRIPLIGKIFTAWSPKSQQTFKKVNGFVFAPILDGFRPARIIAVYPIKNGKYLVQMWFPMIPPTTQTYPDSTIVYAVEAEHNCFHDIADKNRQFEDERYTVFPTEAGLRVEFSGGTTVPEDSFRNLVPLTLREFLRSQGLVNGG